LTEEERIRDVDGALIPSPEGSRGKSSLMIREVNKERILRGYEPY
jgi:hypothetical protein